jgi:hypothetical protein
MKKIPILLFTLLAVFAMAGRVQAQSWGLGLRFGSPTAFTVKHYFKQNAWDLNIGTGPYGFYDSPYGRYRGAGFSVMFNYLWRRDIAGAKGLEWYYGLGAMVNSRDYYYDDKGHRNDEYRQAIGLGPTGALGIEYFIPNSPISLFGELNPYIELIPRPYITLAGGVGGRFVF